MKQKALLDELELLTHDGRMRRMVEVGRSSLDQRSDAKLLAAWEEGGFYERFLSLQACYGSRDGAHVLRSLSDPSRLVRSSAAKMVTTICDNAQVVVALTAARRYLRIRLLHRLFKRHRPQIDLFLASLADDDALLEALPYGSEETVRSHIDRLLPILGQEDWQRLARLHPALVAEIVARQLSDATESEPLIIQRVRLVLPLLAKYDPNAALGLVRGVLARLPAVSLDLQSLAERLPEATAQLLLAQHERDNISAQFSYLAHRLQTATIVDLYKRSPDRLYGPATWFPHLDAAARGAIFAALRVEWFALPGYASDGTLDPAIVAALPRQDRQREARRILALPALQPMPAVRLVYASFLPWDEALPILEPYLRDPDADLRGVALRALILVVRYERSRLPDLLELLLTRRNEQDPVRVVLLNALAELPPSLWQAAHQDALGRVFRDALDAKDLSISSLYAIARLVVRLASQQPQWAAAWLATLMRERRISNFGALEDRLNDAIVQELSSVLLPQLLAWSKEGQDLSVTSFALNLGRRVPSFAGLLDLLERIIKRTREQYNAESILNIFHSYAPDRFAQLIPQLLRKDESWVLRDSVREYLNTQRQDLLTPFLAYRSYRGLFSRGKERELISFGGAFNSWTARQQLAYAGAIEEKARATTRDFPMIVFDFNALAALAAVPPTILLAAARGEAGAGRDMAVQALGRLDSDAGVPTLLEALGDDRARVAIYALRRALAEMPPDRALDLLDGVPLDKVVVAKEVVRLIGALNTDAAYQRLLQLAAGDLHRDVRVALISALSDYLDRDESWPIINSAAASAEGPLALVAIRVRVDRLSPEIERNLIAMLVTVLDHADSAVRSQVLIRIAELPLRDRDRVLLRRLLPFMTDPVDSDRNSANRAIFALATAQDAPLITDSVRQLLANRRAVVGVVAAVEAAVKSDPRKEPIARAVLQVLERDPVTARLRAELAVNILPMLDVVSYLGTMSRAGLLHSDAMATAQSALESGWTRFSLEELEGLEQRLYNSTDTLLRRLAVTALEIAARRGWTTERRERLDTYRADTAPLVAGAAQFVFPPEAAENA